MHGGPVRCLHVRACKKKKRGPFLHLNLYRLALISLAAVQSLDLCVCVCVSISEKQRMADKGFDSEVGQISDAALIPQSDTFGALCWGLWPFEEG